MRRLILGTVISLALTACSSGVGSNTFDYVAQNASNITGVTNADGFGKGGFKGHKGGDFKGGNFGGMFSDLNLTADQQAKLKALRDAQRPAVAPTKPTEAEIQKMVASRKAVEDAFLGDKLDASTLKGLLDAARPVKLSTDDHLTAKANELLQTYNIFTPEQRQKLEDTKKQMEAKMATMKDDARFKNMEANRTKMFDDLVAKFNLSVEQKAAFQALQPVQVDFATMDTKHKANYDAIQVELKSGNATVDSLKAILAKNAPDRTTEQAKRIDSIVKLHDILTADQRKQLLPLVFGHAGGGFKGGEGFGGKGGPRCGKGFGHGFPSAPAVL